MIGGLHMEYLVQNSNGLQLEYLVKLLQRQIVREIGVLLVTSIRRQEID
jgi:hypothetical protein